MTTTNIDAHVTLWQITLSTISYVAIRSVTCIEDTCVEDSLPSKWLTADLTKFIDVHLQKIQNVVGIPGLQVHKTTSIAWKTIKTVPTILFSKYTPVSARDQIHTFRMKAEQLSHSVNNALKGCLNSGPHLPTLWCPSPNKGLRSGSLVNAYGILRKLLMSTKRYSVYIYPKNCNKWKITK